MKETKSGVMQALTILRSMLAYRSQEERKGLPSMLHQSGHRPKDFGPSLMCRNMRRQDRMRCLGIAGSKI